MDKEKSLYIFKLFSSIRKVQGLKSQSFKDMNANGIKTAIFLSLIYEKKVTQSKLVAKMAVAKQTINNIIMDLCEKEYVKTVTDSNDKRIKILVLTKKGESYAKDFLKPLMEFNTILYDKLGYDRVEKMSEDFNLLAEILLKLNKEVMWIA